MIIGIGTDIVNIARVKSLYAKNNAGFLQRILSPQEIKNSVQIRQKSEDRFYSYLAKRFAAKEAISKAMGVGIGENIKFIEASIFNDESGKPFVKLSGTADKYLQKITPDNMAAKIDISLSDEEDYATAFVVISAF